MMREGALLLPFASVPLFPLRISRQYESFPVCPVVSGMRQESPLFLAGSRNYGNEPIMKSYFISILWRCVFIASVLSAFLLTGCEEDERETSPILPGQVAILQVTINPDPVYQGYENKYRYTITVNETNGVGATITSMKVERINSEGTSFDSDDYDEGDVAETFGDSYIQPYGQLATYVVHECYQCEYERWLLRYEDDLGNKREMSATVTMMPR